MMAEENKDPLHQEPTPVVFSKETIEDFARAVASAIDASERSSDIGPASFSSQSSRPSSGERSGHSTLEDNAPNNPFGGPTTSSIEEGLTPSGFGPTSMMQRGFNFLDNFSPSKTSTRKRQFRDDQSSVDGILPTYFGGKVNWQQINKLAIESAMRGGFASNIPGISSALPAMLYADENAVAIQAGIDKAKSIYRTAKAFDQSTSSFGSQLGASPGEGTFSSIGPIRPPFINPAGITGITEAIDSTVYGLANPGISPGEHRGLKSELADVGFFSGQEDQDRLLQGMEELYKFDPAIADAEMLAKATRLGSTPVKDMVKTMKEFKETAKLANIGLEDFNAQVKAAGESAEAAGGSYYTGVKRADQFSAATGFAPEIGESLRSSPIIEGQLSGQFGVPPYALGAISPGMQNMALMDAVQSTMDTVGPMEGIPELGLTGNDMRAAMIKEMLGVDVSTAVIKKMMNKDFAHNYQETMEVSSAIDLAKKHEAKGDPKKMIKSSQQILGKVRGAKNLKGNPLYTNEEIKAVQEAGGKVQDIGFDPVTGEVNLDAISDNSWFDGDHLSSDGENLKKFLQDKGYGQKIYEKDQEYLTRVLEKSPHLKQAFIASERIKAGEKAEEGRKSRVDKDKTNQTESSRATIDFTPKAKEWLRQVDPQGRRRNRRDAGGLPYVDDDPNFTN